MRPYEVVVIINSALEDQQIQAVVTRTTDSVKAQGGSIGRIERWGRRKLAYEIQKKTDGYYVIIEISAEPASIKEINRGLTLSDEVLRHKIIQIEDAGTGRPLTAPAPLDEIPSGGRDRGND
jgi:small subunit ribosomal protein S6